MFRRSPRWSPPVNRWLPTAGTGSPDVTVALTGVSAAAAVGSLAVALSLAVGGVSGTGSPGTLTPATAVAVSGNAATASKMSRFAQAL